MPPGRHHCRCIDYSLSPEAKFPVASRGGGAIRWLRVRREHGIDPARLAVGGDSAGQTGAHRGARAPGRGRPMLRGMLFNYGAFDPQPSTSYELYDGPRYMLTVEEMGYFWNNYVRSPRISRILGRAGTRRCARPAAGLFMHCRVRYLVGRQRAMAER